MSWTPYDADDYVDFDEVETFCRSLATAHPEWIELEVVGTSKHGRPLLVLTISAEGEGPDGSIRGERPAIWLDAGTHASEWTGISAVLYAISKWVRQLLDGDESIQNWFSTHEVVAMPCISPDGVQAMHDGAPYIRSSLQSSHDQKVRSGLDPCDVDGDGTVRMMRWKHPAGTFIKDEDWAPLMRPRTLDDDPDKAYFLCEEGEFINWDGVQWQRAPSEFGLDLNRNFPGQWEPFSMFGMHGGDYPLSEPESRAVVDTFSAHPHIGCALTMHTYTGCLLTPPYRKDTSLGKGDIELMEALARDLADDTGYRVIRVCPDFMYDQDRAIVGVWADTMSTVFGVPGYTVELWDPMGYADLEVDNPLEFLLDPPDEELRKMLQKFAADPDNVQPWRTVDHPQLGEVEIGGIEYLRTVRNPPAKLLANECEKALAMADRARRALPEVKADVEITSLGNDTHRVRLILENFGFLPTSGITRGGDVDASPPVSATLTSGEAMSVDGPPQISLEHFDGWGSVRSEAARNAIYASLSGRGHRRFADWTVHGTGSVEIRWQAGRGGSGTEKIDI